MIVSKRKLVYNLFTGRNQPTYIGVIIHLDVPKIGGKPPKSSILIGFSIINHPFWGFSPYFWKHPFTKYQQDIPFCEYPKANCLVGQAQRGWGPRYGHGVMAIGRWCCWDVETKP